MNDHTLTEVLERVSRAWMTASVELDIRVVAPYRLDAPSGSAECVAFLPDFGGPSGMVIGAIMAPRFQTDKRIMHLCNEVGVYCSFINVDAYFDYRKERFIDALRDWGYFGNAEKQPNWFTVKIGIKPKDNNGGKGAGVEGHIYFEGL